MEKPDLSVVGCITVLFVELLRVSLAFAFSFHALYCTTCLALVSVAPMVSVPSTTVATPVESIQQRLLVQLAQSSTQPGAARPAISVIQLRPGTTAPPPTTLALPSPLAIRSGRPLTLVAAPTTSAAVRLNQVFVLAAVLQL